MTKLDAAATMQVSDCSPAGWVSAGLVSASPLAAASLLEEIWSEVADWECSQASAKRAPDTADLPPPAGMAEPAPKPPTLPARALPINAVLLLDGDDFIAAAYHCLLGRVPEPAAAAELRGEMARGGAKSDIVSAIRASPEAKRWRARVRMDRLVWPFVSLSRLGSKVLPGTKLLAALDQMVYAAGPPASVEAWRADVERRLIEQEAALLVIDTRIGTLQAAQEELSQHTLAALLEQDRLLGGHAERGVSLARQLTQREDELMAATTALSDEVGALGRRLETVTPDSGVAAYSVAPRRSKPARRP